MGKQKTYGRFLGMIFWEEGQPGHPPQGKAVTAAKTPKNRKTTKKSLFFLGQNRQESANKTEKLRRRRERGQPALTLGGSDGVNAKLQALLVTSSVVGRSCCLAAAPPAARQRSPTTYSRRWSACDALDSCQRKYLGLTGVRPSEKSGTNFLL